tara:strand:- start:663 stop:839 length:177 start_codon:yes stop_codon:yes gene_type:complete
MIYLKDKKFGQVKEYKDGDTTTVEDLLATGNWLRVAGRKDVTPYSAPKSSKKTSEKSK